MQKERVGFWERLRRMMGGRRRAVRCRVPTTSDVVSEVFDPLAALSVVDVVSDLVAQSYLVAQSSSEVQEDVPWQEGKDIVPLDAPRAEAHDRVSQPPTTEVVGLSTTTGPDRGREITR